MHCKTGWIVTEAHWSMKVGHIGEERPNRILEALSPFQNSKSKSTMQCQKKKIQSTEWEKIFTNDATNKGLISKTHK